MKTKLERAKAIVEIVAIIAAGLFAFFTWGIDSIRQSSPSWSIAFTDVHQNTAIVEEGIVYVCSRRDCHGANPTTLNLSGTIEIQNKGKIPLNVLETEISIYIVDKFKEQGIGIVNNTTRKHLEHIINKDLKPIFSFLVAPVDDQVLFEGHEAWRPFELSITPTLTNLSISLDEAIRKKEIIIVAKQRIKPDSILRNEVISKAVYHIPSILDQAIPISENKDEDKPD